MPDAVIYRDELPEGCPPAAAQIIKENRVMFHFVERRSDDLTRPLTDGDFKSQRALRPTAAFPGADECIVRGLSVFETHRAAASVLRHTQARGRWADMRICELMLNDGDGAILKTHRGQPATRGRHSTWWPVKGFDFSTKATMIERDGEQ